MLGSVSWLGVGAATIASFALASLWFGPLFGKPWLRELGKTQEAGAATPALAPLLAMQFVATVITATVLAFVLERFDRDPQTGLLVGLMCAVGFVATAKLAEVLFSRTSTPRRYWIEAGNHLVSYALMGLVYRLLP